MLGFNLKKVGTVFSLSIEAGLSVVVGILIGDYIDKYLKTTPWFTIAFTILGFLASVMRLIELVKFLGANKK
ncbi:MAG: AtpZ/AtpI family protein [Deltaproteobacteria bacterium]|nr:AtpZ/AtpI family protein [Deltaproteobacteria bacterium]MCL5791529.1 AtpZ/AtpI family protein [Deltaproteobacteria bacterium]